MIVLVSQAQKKDLEKLREISIQTFAETFAESNSEEDMQKYFAENLNEEKLKSELENPNSEFYFAKNNAEILGYLKLNFDEAQTEQKLQNAMEIERIYILKAFLGQKIGQLLFEKAIEVAKNHQCEHIWLGVWEHNERALKFYEKNGFKIFDKHDFVLGNDIQTDLLMKLTIR